LTFFAKKKHKNRQYQKSKSAFLWESDGEQQNNIGLQNLC